MKCSVSYFTGGMFGLFDGRMDDMLMLPGATTNKIYMCPKDADMNGL